MAGAGDGPATSSAPAQGLDLHDLVDSYHQVIFLLGPAMRRLRQRRTWAAMVLCVILVPANLALSTLSFGAAMMLLVGNVEFYSQNNQPPATLDWHKQGVVFSPTVTGGDPEEQQVERVAESLQTLRDLLALLARCLDRLQGCMVEIERVRRWVDPRHSARVVWLLVGVGIVLAVTPFAQTLVTVLLLAQFYRLVSSTPTSESADTVRRLDLQDPNVTEDHAKPGSEQHHDALRAASASQADGDLWVLVSGGSSSDADATTLTKRNSQKETEPFSIRIRDMLTETRDKQRTGVRCKACNTLIDTIFKRKAVCSQCDLSFCTTCCPPRKNKARLCKGCTAHS